MAAVDEKNLMDLAHRIREMRQITGLSVNEMAKKTEVSVDQYLTYEEGLTDIPFTFIHKCALTFNVGMSDLLEGQSARLSTCTVMRKGHRYSDHEYGTDVPQQDRRALLGQI